ncbi:hypothetical protein Cni_G00347 [Canna indica]|uniref:Uncharacterized protein n=1 Tax=Canna indica TaxID=4628 RepID=A0AAQ3JKR7_9LILI|nr:hypothetical protein Cni_G00347 [Canna indica]
MDSVDGARSPDEAAMKRPTDSERKGSDLEASVCTPSSRGRKIVTHKDNGHSFLNSVNKPTAQIKKPPHRKSGSPLNWFPRKKADSFLKRKIKQLQEIGGMNLSLDETLGNANPHYTRIAREKIAAQEAAKKAMEARKAAMVEASWCRILGAARIKSKEAESRLEEAEKCAAEAFEAARAMGVMMYDKPDCPRQSCKIETSAIGGRSTHKVTASFETAFEVDKEVAAAVKRAFVQLANCASSLNKEECGDLLLKISQNPEDNGATEGLQKVSSECNTDHEANLKPDSLISGDTDDKHAARIKQRKYKNSLLPVDAVNSSSISPTKLSDTMLDRLKGLHEHELASLAVIVATCGLSAALREMQGCQESKHQPGSCSDDNTRKKGTLTEVPSLDKFLVKRVSRLEKEVQEAKNNNVASHKQIKSGTSEFQIESKISDKSESQVDPTLGLGSILVKHVSKLERDILEAKKKCQGTSLVENGNQTETLQAESNSVAAPSDEIPTVEENQSNSKEESKGGLSGILYSKECEQLSNFRGLTESIEHHLDLLVMPEKVQRSYSNGTQQNKENVDSNIDVPSSTDLVNEMNQSNKHISRIERAKIEALQSFSAKEKIRGDDTHETLGLDKILVKPMHRLTIEKEKVQAFAEGRKLTELRDHKKENNGTVPESLDTILVKHVSRLEKEKLRATTNEGTRSTVKKGNQQSKEWVGSLDEILVNNQSKLEKARLVITQPSSDYVKHEARREARERELQEAWGGLSLGNSLKPHISRIEREKVNFSLYPFNFSSFSNSSTSYCQD